VSWICRILARTRRRVTLAYHLACARQDMRHQGLRAPSGIWFCEHCRLVLWDLDTFVVHGRAHAV
jgi:hypothetical protein